MRIRTEPYKKPSTRAKILSDAMFTSLSTTAVYVRGSSPKTKN